MAGFYAVNLLSPAGLPAQRIDDWQTLSWTRSVNAVGQLTLTLPFRSNTWRALRKDDLLEVTAQTPAAPSGWPAARTGY